MDIRIGVGNRYVVAKKSQYDSEKRKLVAWSYKQNFRELLTSHLEEIEGKKRQVFRLKAEKAETTGPFPPGFHFHKKRLDYLAGRQVDRILEQIPSEEFEKSLRIPVDPKILAVLYHKGRLEYLKERLKLGPQQKEKFAKVSSWQHGWWLEDKREPASLVTRPHVLRYRYRPHGVFQVIEGPDPPIQNRNL